MCSSDLSELLDIAYFDKELIAEASKRSGVCQDFLEKADEKAPSLLDYALISGFGNENVLSSGNFYVLQSNVITSVAEEKSCVIVGRSADYILRNHPCCINLFIHAPKKFRIKQVAHRLELTNHAAEVLIDKNDKTRAKFYNFYTDKTWGASSSYNLSVDSSMLGIEETAQSIKEFIIKYLTKTK